MVRLLEENRALREENQTLKEENRLLRHQIAVLQARVADTTKEVIHMTEKEKMLAGELYAPGDAELMDMWNNGKNLMQKYNSLDYSNKIEQMKMLDELLGAHGEQIQITAPFYIDYGKFIFIGNNCEINMNCVFLDCNKITIGDNVLIAPGVHIYTVFHPVNAHERFNKNQYCPKDFFKIVYNALNY